MKRAIAVLALVGGMAAGYSAVLALGGAPIEPSDTPSPGPMEATRTPPSSTATPEASTTTTTTIPEPTLETYLIWASGGLPPGLAEGLLGSFGEVTVVKGDMVEMAGPESWLIPLDALAFDSETVGPFDPAAAVSSLAPGQVVLSESSAALRGTGPNDEMTIGDATFQVAAVVPDAEVAAAEVVFRTDDPELPVQTDRYALVRTDLSRPEFEREVRALHDGGAPLRIRTSEETPWLRHGDAVLPQVYIKEALGEFSYTDATGTTFEQHSGFRQRWIVTADVPLLGQVTCHETVVEMLTGAMDQLSDEGLGHLVDASGHRGCWNPRLIRSVSGEPSGLSRHSWGAAVDLNATTNPLGSAGDQDERLVDVMEAWGFTWGGDWVVPDPMHFEYGRPPE